MICANDTFHGGVQQTSLDINVAIYVCKVTKDALIMVKNK
jgi:hypothetical protein